MKAKEKRKISELKKRAALLLLAGSMLLSAVGMAGCGTDESATDTAAATESASAAAGDSSTTDAAGETSTEKTAEQALERIGTPDLEKKVFTILYTNSIAGYKDEIYSEGYGASSGIYGQGVTDAVYERNTLLAERCNLTLDLIGRESGTVSTLIRTEVNSPTGAYQLATETSATTASMATEGLLQDWLTLGDIDFDTAWWDSGTLDFALNGRVYFMNGALNFVDDDVTFVMIFNKKLQSENHIPDLYQTTKDGDWTLDYFYSIIQGKAIDSNGDGSMSAEDTYGFTAPCSIGNTFFYGAGMHYIDNSRDKETPELALGDGDMTKATTLLDKVREITLGGTSSYIAPSGSEAVASDIFKQGRSIFYCEAANYLCSLNRDMVGDYGVVPIPKYDKTQEKYLTWVHSISSTFSIPRSAGMEDVLAAVAETYAVLSYQLVKPAYYDNMLTQKTVRDGESGEMLDLIFQNRVYDMAVYFTDLGFSGLFSDAALASTGNFASKYKAASKSFPRRIKNMLKGLERTEGNG